MTPQRTSQFATFTESSYEGNPFLCGPPLHNNCMETKETPMSSLVLECCEADHGFLVMESFYISFLVAYANVVLALVVVLCVNPYWRNVWFYYVDSYELVFYSYLYYTYAVALLGFSLILSTLESFNVEDEAVRVLVAAPLLAYTDTDVLYSGTVSVIKQDSSKLLAELEMEDASIL
ncbi:hypothetical protein P3S68_033345 [Capsicum galapagoense]